jgi:hypothetical protein
MKQDRLCWRRPAAIYRTDRPRTFYIYVYCTQTCDISLWIEISVILNKNGKRQWLKLRDDLQFHCDTAVGLQINVTQDPNKLFSLSVGLRYKLLNKLRV